MASQYPGFVSPLPPGSSFLRIDQGVDYDCPTPVLALGDGVVARVAPPGSFQGGTGQAVYITLKRPVTVNGHTYSQVYYAERAPLVRQTQLVFAGEAIMAPGTNELGFARNNLPACPPAGGIGAGSKPTVCGNDFNDFVQALEGRVAPPQPIPPPGGFVDTTQAHVAFKRVQISLLRDLPQAMNSASSTVKAARRHLTRASKILR